MFVDSSILVAILAREPGYEEIIKRLDAESGPFQVSPLVRFEAVIALARKKAEAAGERVRTSPALISQAHLAVDAFLRGLEATDVAISPEIGDLAIMAAAKYGKAVGHKADLNFGDCFAYASAKALGVPLLYKGNDFAETDLA